VKLLDEDMSSTEFTSIITPADQDWRKLLKFNSAIHHIHWVDMPFRQASTWQDHGCEFGIWQKNRRILAWAVFLPPWWNLDFAIYPEERDSHLESEVFAWGKEQMLAYSRRSGESFWGSIEIFENRPNADRTVSNLAKLGFQQFEWSTLRFEISLDQATPQSQIPGGFQIRPLAGESEVDEYVSLHRAVFGSDRMTRAWRLRTLDHPTYRSEIDLVVVSPEGKLVGFCICWMWHTFAQIEPLGIHPDYQGLGLGSALELSALETLRKLGARLVYLDHVSLNANAIALSLKNGFRQSNNALRYYVDTLEIE
jgi:ribosomal protein S18 acetylase RimI-like enzyme